jgi:hypothetical protein
MPASIVLDVRLYTYANREDWMLVFKKDLTTYCATLALGELDDK